MSSGIQGQASRRSNPLGVHALVWAGGTTPTEVAHAVGQAATAGFDLLEISLHDLERLDVEAARQVIEGRGLQVACSRGLAFDADVSSEDPAVVERGAALLHRSLETTIALGGKILTGALYSALGKYAVPPTDAGRSNAVAVLRDVADSAAAADVSIGLEICNRYETNLVNTAESALALADQIDRTNVVIHLDTYHMNIEESDLAQPVHRVGERLGYVHIGESHRGYLGSGHLDFNAFFHALAAVEYTGPITFESFSSAVVAPGLSHDLAVWRDLWTDGFDLATHARRFLDAQLDAAAHVECRI